MVVCTGLKDLHDARAYEESVGAHEQREAAMAVGQSISCRLIHHYREQARSYRKSILDGRLYPAPSITLR